jgi:hypothetical protein
MHRLFQSITLSVFLVGVAALTPACVEDSRRSSHDDDDDDSGSTSDTGDPTTTGGDGYTPPAFAHIEIVGTVVQPWMADRTTWDGTSYVEEADIQGLAEALGTPSPYAAVLDYVAKLANSAYAPPDPAAWAEIWRDGDWNDQIGLCTFDNNDEDTFATNWKGDPVTGYELGWSGVPVTEEMRIRVHVIDEDISEHDSIGTVDIGYNDVIAALKENQVVPIRVDDQDLGQVLFVGISAIPQ